MKRLIFMAALALAGCSETAGKRAEAEYRLARSMPMTMDEKCAAQRKVEAGYLADGDRHKYQIWRLTASITCNRAAIAKL